jgi:hypothetical protein
MVVFYEYMEAVDSVVSLCLCCCLFRKAYWEVFMVSIGNGIEWDTPLFLMETDDDKKRIYRKYAYIRMYVCIETRHQ